MHASTQISKSFQPVHHSHSFQELRDRVPRCAQSTTYFDGAEFIIPLSDVSGVLRAYQTISQDGTKRTHHKTKGALSYFYMLGQELTNPSFITEDYDTAVELHEATGATCIVTARAIVMPSVVKAIRDAGHDETLIVPVLQGDVDPSEGFECRMKSACFIAGHYSDVHLMSEGSKGLDMVCDLLDKRRKEKSH